MRITWMFRKIDIDHEPSMSSGTNNPNGGVSSKAFHLSRALPHAKLITNIDQAGDICFAEALWFSEITDIPSLEERVKKWEELKAFKVIANSDLALLRMSGDYRDRLIDASDLVASTSIYGHKLFEAFTTKSVVLYDPIDVDMFIPSEKEREIYSIGQVNLVKNVQMVVDIFNQISEDVKLKKTYIGSSELWGESSGSGLLLENSLYHSCDHLEKLLSRIEIPKRISSIWGYVADTRYDMACFSMMEAMLCGCWVFTGRHLLYNERPGLRFNTAGEAVKQICVQLDKTPPESGIINEEARQHIVDKNGYDSFRRDFKDTIGRHALGI